tara:strand:- start:96 stop:521 length:426 start_codon:yes stop_codon:yes gene_type:complete
MDLQKAKEIDEEMSGQEVIGHVVKLGGFDEEGEIEIEAFRKLGNAANKATASFEKLNVVMNKIEQDFVDQEYIDHFALLAKLRTKRTELQVTKQSRYTPLFKAITITSIELEIDTLMEKADELPNNYFVENNPSFLPIAGD